MSNHLNEKIKNLKDKIADIKDYLHSDVCQQCISFLQEIQVLEKELQDLENERH